MTPQPLGSRYVLEDPLRPGRTGTVWRGRDSKRRIPYAIRVLPPEFTADPAAVLQFVRERTVLTTFRHPNVVPLRDILVEGDYLALVMDLVDGDDLDTYRRSGGGTLPLGESLGLATQICDALAAAHAAGIVHRNLKPANVLLETGQVRLADLGLAQIADQASAATTGTIGFLAPEVIRGEAPTPACDVYAVGITLHELLTGTLPFTGDDATVLQGHLDTVPSKPAGVPATVWTLMSACLSKDPAVRPTAAALARALCEPALLREPALLPELPPDPALPPEPALPHEPATDETLHGSPASHASVTSPRPGRRGPRRPLSRALLATAAAIALIVTGVSATFLVTSGSGSGKSAAPRPTQLRAATQSPPPTLPGAAGNTPGQRPSQSPGPSGGPSGPSASPTGSATSPASAGPSASASASATATPSATPSASSGPPGSTGPNLVADGDFSQPTLGAWDNKVANTVIASLGPNGGYAAQMTGQLKDKAGVSQIVTGLQPGTAYELTGWILSATGDNGTYVGVKGYDSTPGGSRATAAASTWTEVAITFTPAAGYTTAEVFCAQAVAGIGYCTDISLRALG